MILKLKHTKGPTEKLCDYFVESLWEIRFDSLFNY